MPFKPKRPCKRPGCYELVAKAYCEKHQPQSPPRSRREHDQKYQETRTDYKHHLFYNSDAWKRLRKWKLRRAPLCEHCECKGKVKPAEMVDHIVEIKDDWSLRLKKDNLQSLCWRCHTAKTLAERRKRKAQEASQTRGGGSKSL